MEALALDGGVLKFDLTRGFVALVDAERFEQTLTYHFRDGREFTVRPSSLNWVATKSQSCWYSVAFVRTRSAKWGMKLHRLLIEAPADKLVDHISGDTMDCRLANLRLCSVAASNRNRAIRSDSVSGLKGVRRNRERFTASIWANNGRLHLGTFATAEEAARAYDAAAIKHFGEFARLNFQSGA